MDFRWNYSTVDSQDVLEKIFSERGVNGKEEIAEFLSDKPKKTYLPELILNMDAVVETILFHIESRNKIVIAGDYDMDGIGAVSVLVEFLSNIGGDIEYYIPNRYIEGYGLSIESVDNIFKNIEPKLMITVDNGISCYKEIEYAKSLGIEVIVTDHHMPPEKLPECLILNVKQKGDNYPFKELCGCGLAFKLCQAIKNKKNIDKSILNKTLDIVALSTIGDVVTLTDENRTLVKYGLNQIHVGQRLGIKSLCDELDIKIEEVKSGTIGFRIAPCFNASGRMEDASIGVKLLLETDINKAIEYAKYLKNLNEERKLVQEQGELICISKVESKYKDDNFLIIREDSVSEGVMGIIAGRIREKYYKPTIILTQSEKGVLKGSGRSIEGLNIYDEVSKCSDLIKGFGGHANACGLSIDEENLEEFRNKLNESIRERKDIEPELFYPSLSLIDNLNIEQLNFELLDIINRLEPFGMGNTTPLFSLKNIAIAQDRCYCGENNKHFKIWGQCNGKYVSGIGFQLGDKYLNAGEPKKLDVAFVPQINEWQGKKNIQLSLKDFKESL